MQHREGKGFLRESEEKTEEIRTSVEVWLPYLTNNLVVTEGKAELCLTLMLILRLGDSYIHTDWLPME